MKSAYAFVLALLALMPGSPARAADWVPVLTAGTQNQYFYDRSKLTIKDDEITYWKKVMFASPQTFSGHEVVSGLLRERLHCAEHTSRLVSYLYYAAGGETVEYVEENQGEPSPIIPDSVGDAFEGRLCPLVWQKQEENRIKTEQKAAQAELAALKKVERTLPATAPATAPAATPPAKTLAPATPLPAPQIKEQLY